MHDLLEWLYVYESLIDDGDRDEEASVLLKNIIEKMAVLLAN